MQRARRLIVAIALGLVACGEEQSPQVTAEPRGREAAPQITAPPPGSEAVARMAAEPRAISSRGEFNTEEAANIRLFERSKDAVVYITTTQRVLDLLSRNVFSIPRGTGSGFVWDDAGHIVTNNHVIMDAAEARVRLNDGRDYGATLVGASSAHDIAVLRIRVPERRPAPLPIGSSADLKVGQSVFAIGNPFGLDWSLTTGIVSALNRSLPSGDGSTLIQELIQTDAAINPGNSGGPLLDSAGRLIGMNTAIYSPSGAYAGVGFAVPVATVNRVVPQLISKGSYARPMLGIQADEALNQMLRKRLGVKGVAVAAVEPGSAAAEAGLRPAKVERDGGVVPGDMVLAIDGKRVDDVAQLLARLDEKKVGDTVAVTLLRDGKQVDVRVTLRKGKT